MAKYSALGIPDSQWYVTSKALMHAIYFLFILPTL